MARNFTAQNSFCGSLFYYIGLERRCFMSEKKSIKKALANENVRWVLSLLIVVAAAFIIRNNVMSTVRVKGISMEPNFKHDEITIVNKIAYKIGKPNYGDIIICSYDSSVSSDFVIKRVIGLPNDEINIVFNGDYFDLYRNGELLKEDYINEPNMQPGDTNYPYIVPEDCYFVMGDNRNASTDSRYSIVGAVPTENIMGKVAAKIWPLNRFELY